MKDCLKLIHFHIGSQVTKIRRIKTALERLLSFMCSFMLWDLMWSLLILVVD
jgi:arginine decarboxylase-like protein